MTRILACIAAILATPLVLFATTITGTVTSRTGAPFVVAHVHLADAMGRPSQSVAAKKDGSYSLKTSLTGLYYVTFTAVDHRMAKERLLLAGQKSVVVNGTLVPNAATNEIDSVLITGDFNQFAATAAMRRGDNGTFVFDVAWPAKTMRYQVQIFTKGMSPAALRELHTVNGTQFTSVEYDSGGDYRSVISVTGGKASITFDPRRLVVADKVVPQVSIETPADLERTTYMNASDALVNKIVGGLRVAGRDTARQRSMQDTVHAHIARVLAEPASTTDPLLRALRTIRLLLLADYAADNPPSEQEPICKAFNGTSPASPAWSCAPTIIRQGMMLCGDTTNAYYTKVLAANTSNGVRPVALLAMLERSFDRGNKAKVAQYYGQLTKEYPDHWATDRARKDYSPDKKILVGKRVPAFSYVSLDDPRVTFTPESYKGKYVLIDLWATWCGPCVAEMPNLHKAYEKFKGPDFEVLSLSMDQDKDRITPFRKKWAMPWNHGFAPGVWESQIAELFEASSIPKPILVGPDGTILAITTGLRGEDLEKTLSTYLKR